MRERMVHRYYCDHCGKGGCSKGHMARHERGCTKNVKRVCGLCARAEFHQKTADELVAAFRSGADEASSMKALRDACENCPACILMTLRILCPPIRGGGIEPGERPFPDFRFKAELENFWKRVEESDRDNDSYGVY